MSARGFGLLAGYAADLLLGDPRRCHPVAGLGQAAAALERRTYRDSRLAGAVHTGALVVGTAALAMAADRAVGGKASTRRAALPAVADRALSDPRTSMETGRPQGPEVKASAGDVRPLRRTTAAARAVAQNAAAELTGVAEKRAARQRTWTRIALTAALTWTVVGGRTLRREAAGIAAAIERGDLDEARRRLPSLCGRDPSNLTEAELVRATLESVAENTSDAVVAPLYWGAIGGPAGLAGYRVANTLDAMIGHKSPRYRRFGWAAARLDDVANWVPARLAAALAVALAPLVGGSPASAARVWLRDGDRHPSPNAGQVEAAFAGALGVTLGGGENRYAGHTDTRPAMGDGPAPTVADLRRANRLAAAVSAAAAIGAACIAWRASVGRSAKADAERRRSTRRTATASRSRRAKRRVAASTARRSA